MVIHNVEPNSIESIMNARDEQDPAPDELTDEHEGNHATWYILRCKTLRESAGLRKNALARDADVDRATIDKIEKRHPVTRPTAFRVFNALNAKHATKLDSSKEITNTLAKKRR